MENFRRDDRRGSAGRDDNRGSRGSFRNGGGKGGFKGGFKGGWKGRNDDRSGSFGDKDSRPVVLHPATCESCKKPCEVPFKPNGDKPVYCRDCFAGRAAMGGDRSKRKDFRNDRGERNEERTFAPRAFSASTNSSFSNAASVNKENEYLKKQIEIMNAKLDKLTAIVEGLVDVE